MEAFNNPARVAQSQERSYDASKYLEVNKKCACLGLRKAARAATQLYDSMLEPCGIRATQFTLLILLASVPSGKTLTEMAAGLVMDRTTLTRNLKPLEKAELIASVIPADRRSRAYTLTPKGWETLQKGLPLWEQAQKLLSSSVSEDNFDELIKEVKVLTDKIIDM